MNSQQFKFLENISPVPKDFYRHNRERLLALLKKSSKFDANGLIFLSGPKILLKNDDDGAERTLHEPFFYYLFGIMEETDTFAIISLKDGKTTVFTRLPDASEIFWTKPKNLEEFKKNYEIDDAKSIEDLKEFLENHGKAKEFTIYLNDGISPVSGKKTSTPEVEFADILKDHKVDLNILYPFGRECRVFKSDEEIQILRDSIKIASFAHKSVMKIAEVGMTEKQLSDYFSSINFILDSDIPYGNIFCAGANGSYLHYQPSPNIKFKDGQLILNDSAAKLYGYNSDITRTFPVNGKFSEKQKAIYNIVLQAQKEAEEMTKPGMVWMETHLLAESVILEGLWKLGLITGKLEDMKAANLAHVFMPHGLGHYIGLYVHDLPGLESLSEKKESKNIKSGLGKIDRILKKGMVLTIEPGIYFNEVLLNDSYANEKLKPFLVRNVIEEYKKEVGGIRIEDMYLITETKNENLSKNLIKTVEEIEYFMQK